MSMVTLGFILRTACHQLCLTICCFVMTGRVSRLARISDYLFPSMGRWIWDLSLSHAKKQVMVISNEHPETYKRLTPVDLVKAMIYWNVSQSLTVVACCLLAQVVVMGLDGLFGCPTSYSGCCDY